MRLMRLGRLCDIDLQGRQKKFFDMAMGGWGKQHRRLIGQALDLFNGISQKNFFLQEKQVFDWLNQQKFSSERIRGIEVYLWD